MGKNFVYNISIVISLLALLVSCHDDDDPGFRGLAEGESSVNTSSRRTDAAHCSLYMKELQAFIARAATNYLAPFQSQEIVMKW